jgi:hypothetical protein
MKPPELDRDFEALLDYLKRNQSCDFTGYKRPTLMRRFSCRMQQLHIERYQDYLQYLQSHSQEWIELLDSILINVSSFFRDRKLLLANSLTNRFAFGVRAVLLGRKFTVYSFCLQKLWELSRVCSEFNSMLPMWIKLPFNKPDKGSIARMK